MGSSSSSASTRSTYSCYLPEAKVPIGKPQTGNTYTLPCGRFARTFSVLLYVSTAERYCPDLKTLNSAYSESLNNIENYKNNYGFFVTNNCYDSAIDFLYYHAIENGLMNPAPLPGASRLSSFNVVGTTFMNYIILDYAIRSANATVDETKQTEIIQWLDKLNTEYTSPYIDYTNNLYYIYSNKMLTYLHIKRIQNTDSRFEAILTKITEKFKNTRKVAISENFSNVNKDMPYVQIISGTKTVGIIDTAGNPVLDSSGKQLSLTVTFDNDYFITSEYRYNRVRDYHNYYLRLLFATLIVLKLKNARQSFFDTIKPVITGIMNTLRKLVLPASGSASNTASGSASNSPNSLASNYNAVDLYTVWGGGTKADEFDWSAIDETYGEYKYIFENAPMRNHDLMGFSIKSDPIIKAFNGTAY
jgi:hypothetical protein